MTNDMHMLALVNQENSQLRQHIAALEKSNRALKAELLAERRERKQLAYSLDLADESRSLLHQFVRHASTAIFVRDVSGRFLFVNSHFAAPFYYLSQPITGKTPYDLFSTECAALLLEHDQQVIATGEPAIHEESVPYRDGLHTYLAARFPLYNTQGDIYAVGGVATDISRRKQMEMVLEQTRAQLRELARRVTLIQEDERGRLSRELHDETGQSLTVLLMDLQYVSSCIHATDSEARARLTEAIALVHATTERLRLLAQDLRPPTLDAMDLSEALTDLCTTFARRTALMVKIVTVPLPRLSDEASISLYRFVQEALTNVARHAEAQHVQVEMNADAEQVSIVVQDDGRGMVVSQEMQDSYSSLGLAGMRERLAFLGGTLELSSQPGQGTRVTASIPWSEEP